MSNSYLMGAMLDPLVVEFMSPAYREGMLEAKIRTDEIRGNCPPRAGYVCVLDPRVKTGRYYRKHVEGEGVKALPPSRIEKALSQQEQRSQKGEGISFLGKAAIAGGLAVGGLAAIGAIANSGRSTEPIPDVPNAKVKPPDTSEKPKSSTYEEAKQVALSAARERRVKPPAEAINNEVFTVNPRESPKEARRKRGGNPKSADEIQAEIDKAFDENEKLKKNSPQGVAAVSPEAARKPRSSRDRDTRAADLLLGNEELLTAVREGEPVRSDVPDVLPAIKRMNIPAGTATRDASHAVIEANYSTLPPVAGKLNIGYKSVANIKDLLHKNEILLRAKYANPTSEDKLNPTQQRKAIDGILDNGLIAKDGYLVQKIAGKGGYGKDLTAKIRVPAFMSIEDFDNAVQGIEPPQKKGERVRSTPEARIKAADDLIEAINEKVSKSPSLTTTEKQALDFYKTRVERQRENDLIEKEPKRVNDKVGAEPVKTPAKPKVEQPKFEEGSPAAKIMGVLGEDVKAIGQSFKSMDAKQQVKLNKLADNLSPDEAKTMAGYLKGLNFNNAKITGAAANRTAFAKRLEAIALVKANPKPPVVAENPPAIAEKPPEDPNTYPLGSAVPQTPVVRPEPAKPNYAAEQKAQRAIAATERIKEKSNSPSTPKSSVEGVSLKDKEAATQKDPVKNPPIIGGVKTYKMTDLTSGWFSKENMNSVQIGDRIIGREYGGIAKGGIVVDKLVLDKRNGEAIREFSKKYGEDNVITDVHSGGFAFTKENINISKEGKIELMASTPPMESIKQSEVKASKPQNKRSSKKQAPKPEDFPLDIPSAMNNVKIMESDLKNNEVLLEKWLNEKVVEVNPQKIANLKKKIANQKKDIKAKQEEVFDYIAKTQQNNDAIAPHETYYSAREQAKRDALRRFAA